MPDFRTYNRGVLERMVFRSLEHGGFRRVELQELAETGAAAWMWWENNLGSTGSCRTTKMLDTALENVSKHLLILFAGQASTSSPQKTRAGRGG